MAEPDERPQSLGEEIANSISHGIGLLGALAAFPILIVFTARRGNTAGMVGTIVFATTMVLLYFSSTLFHSFTEGKAKRVFQILDHTSIFFLIAGTYTPFTMGVLRGGWGWTLFGIIWGLAILGTVMKAIGGLKGAKASVLIYLSMGWLIVIAAKPTYTLMPKWGLFWLFAGGISYTAGVVFYAAERIKYFHFVWHIFVVIGTTCHFFAVLWYSM